MDNKIVFVTHNTGKIKSAERYFKNLKFTTFNYELNEPRSDDIKETYEIVKRPCLALDTDFRIDELNGFPRAFVNFSLDTIGINGILKLMENKRNRKCAFNECLAYHDGKEIHLSIICCGSVLAVFGEHLWPGGLCSVQTGLHETDVLLRRLESYSRRHKL